MTKSDRGEEAIKTCVQLCVCVCVCAWLKNGRTVRHTDIGYTQSTIAETPIVLHFLFLGDSA